MNLQERLEVMYKLGTYLTSEDEQWLEAKASAYTHNAWFIPSFIDIAVQNIASAMLQPNKLEHWLARYEPIKATAPRKVGLVMAGNIPLVGFHDFLSIFMSGHRQVIKTSSKDDILIRHLVIKLIEWQPEVAEYVQFADMLKGCDAYIATGSDNTSRYFAYYFGRYPHIIRKNRTSVAILTGKETAETLSALADDIMLYFGLGCRNITQIYVPADYDFQPLLDAVKQKYAYFFEHHKYRNNYDYQLAIYLMNKIPYLTNNCLLLVENESPFSPIGSLHYLHYTDAEVVYDRLRGDERIQAIVGEQGIAPGTAQQPGLMDYADGVDTMQFLLNL